ncbi:hypothetical protein JNA59_10895 [Salmonella enterica subsp. enterica serovar Typhimurium]|nr:hypothetical protein [Salmonella enterica subsp. enterica serovar Typhimurium]
MIDECQEPLKSVVEFALSTGLRRSNIINLEWQQIHATKGGMDTPGTKQV